MGKKLYCTSCGNTDNLLSGPYAKYTNKKGVVTEYYLCRSCNSLRRRKYYQTKTGKSNILKAQAKYEAAHPERRKAWRAAGSIDRGSCEVCGARPTHRHHPDVLDRLAIVFLCPLHHKEAHMVL